MWGRNSLFFKGFQAAAESPTAGNSLQKLASSGSGYIFEPSAYPHSCWSTRGSPQTRPNGSFSGTIQRWGCWGFKKTNETIIHWWFSHSIAGPFSLIRDSKPCLTSWLATFITSAPKVLGQCVMVHAQLWRWSQHRGDTFSNPTRWAEDVDARKWFILDTVDGRNLAPVGRWFIPFQSPLFTGFHDVSCHSCLSLFPNGVGLLPSTFAAIQRNHRSSRLRNEPLRSLDS